MILTILVTLLSPLLALAKSPSLLPAKIKTINADPEPFRGDAIHIQCLVDYHEPAHSDDITVELRRFVFKTSETQSLSSNGIVQIEVVPKGQKYDAYVINSGQNAKEHAFKIFNINVDKDSGIYKCLVKHKGQVIDTKEIPINVEDVPTDPPTTGHATTIIVDTPLKTELKCPEKRKH